MTNGQWELEELEAVLELPEICILPMEAWGPGTNGRARNTLGARPLRPTSGGQGYSVHCICHLLVDGGSLLDLLVLLPSTSSSYLPNQSINLYFSSNQS